MTLSNSRCHLCLFHPHFWPVAFKVHYLRFAAARERCIASSKSSYLPTCPNRVWCNYPTLPGVIEAHSPLSRRVSPYNVYNAQFTVFLSCLSLSPSLSARLSVGRRLRATMTALCVIAALTSRPLPPHFFLPSFQPSSDHFSTFFVSQSYWAVKNFLLASQV